MGQHGALNTTFPHAHGPYSLGLGCLTPTFLSFSERSASAVQPVVAFKPSTLSLLPVFVYLLV